MRDLFKNLLLLSLCLMLILGGLSSAFTKTYSDGKYLVGKDIEPGLYKVNVIDKVTKMGYIERDKDLRMGTDSILANDVFLGDGYVRILATDVAVKLQGVEIEKIELDKIKPNIKNETTDGVYLVGYDLVPGIYKVEVTDTTTKMGYVARLSDVTMSTSDIIANEIVQGQSYVEIKSNDFAVKLQGVKIIRQ